jgi:hypothetical protein
MVLISSGLRTRDASQDKHSDRSQVEIHQGLVDVCHGSLNQREETSPHPDDSQLRKS